MTFDTLFASDKFTIMVKVPDVPAPTEPTPFQRGISEFTRQTKLYRRAIATFPGVVERCEMWVWSLEAFGDTADACAEAVARYTAAYPTDTWSTRFCAVKETADGFVSAGSRNRDRNWV